MRTSLNKKLDRLEYLKETLNSAVEQMEGKDVLIANIDKAQIIMQKSAKISQDHLASHLSNIVTQAIQAVIQKPYEFVCEFVERRGSTEADLYLLKGGNRFEILMGTGGGLADVISLSLKVAYLLLSNVDKVLIIDEPARHINDISQRERFVEVLTRLSREFDVQFVLTSTLPELVEAADKLITFKIDANDSTFTV